MKLILLLAVTLLNFVALPSYASGQHSLSQYRKGQALAVQNPQQAARIAKSRFGGRVLKVSKKKQNGRTGYKVKLIKKDGHIISVFVDAQSGRVQG